MGIARFQESDFSDIEARALLGEVLVLSPFSNLSSPLRKRAYGSMEMHDKGMLKILAGVRAILLRLPLGAILDAVLLPGPSLVLFRLFAVRGTMVERFIALVAALAMAPCDSKIIDLAISLAAPYVVNEGEPFAGREDLIVTPFSP